LTPSKAHDDGAMIPKHPSEGGERDEAREAIDIEQTLDFCHADIVTEFRKSAISISSGFFQGIHALTDGIHPLKNANIHNTYVRDGDFFAPP
jgi:hypothetical protein